MLSEKKKKANPKRIHTVLLHLCNILEINYRKEEHISSCQGLMRGEDRREMSVAIKAQW